MGRGIKRKVSRNVREGREAKCMDYVTPGCSARMTLKTFSFMRSWNVSHTPCSPRVALLSKTANCSDN